jgi:hypothetical protein
MRLPLALVSTGLLAACAVPDAIESLADRSPPPEFGRPAWVRTSAGVGAWLGGILGGVVAVVALPITYPISLLAEDGLGEYSTTEFLMAPALAGASVGHALLGTPPDVLDYVFRRAWSESSPPVTEYSFVPLENLELPQPLPAEQKAEPQPGAPR